jgi:hypothetical protein
MQFQIGAIQPTYYTGETLTIIRSHLQLVFSHLV